jgi:hypothetical protein
MTTQTRLHPLSISIVSRSKLRAIPRTKTFLSLSKCVEPISHCRPSSSRSENISHRLDNVYTSQPQQSPPRQPKNIMVYDKHFIPSPPKPEVSPTSSASSESSEDYIPGRDLLDTERYTRFQRELAQRIASYTPTDGVASSAAPAVTVPVATRAAPRVALPVALPMRISEQTREDDGGVDYEEEEYSEGEGVYSRGAMFILYIDTTLTIHRRRRRGRRMYPRHTRRTSCNTP